jgi:hypothetical protein
VVQVVQNSDREFSQKVLDMTNMNLMTINKRINVPPIFFPKQTIEKRGIVTALPWPRGEKESLFYENPDATVTFVRAAI